MLIRHLMSHTSGIIYSFIQPQQPISKAWVAGGEQRQDLSAKDWSEQVVAKLPMIAEPGTAWNYSQGLDVLGGVIEKITGQTLEEAVRERVTGPLGMTDTGFIQPKDKAPRFAQSQKQDPLYYDYTMDRVLFAGGGGLSSTAEDYLRFVQMLANHGEYRGVRILKPETVDLMMIDQTTAEIRGKGLFFPGAGMGFGLGMSLVIDDTKTTPRQRHVLVERHRRHRMVVRPEERPVHGLHDPGPRAALRIPEEEPHLDLRRAEEVGALQRLETEKGGSQGRPFCFNAPHLLARIRHPRAHQDVRQRLVVLVARRREHARVHRPERILRQPRRGIALRILDRELVEQLVLRHAREALDHVRVRASPETCRTARARLHPDAAGSSPPPACRPPSARSNRHTRFCGPPRMRAPQTV